MIDGVSSNHGCIPRDSRIRMNQIKYVLAGKPIK